MPYCVEPDQIRIRFKKRDAELYEKLCSVSEMSGLSLSEVSLRLLSLVVSKVSKLPMKHQQELFKVQRT
jgi:hypothetical protein